MAAGTSYDVNNLVQRMSAGDEESFRQFFHIYFKRICFFAESLISDRDDAKDIAQETLFQLWLRRRDFKSEPSARSFLYISARNASLNYLKALKRRTARQQELHRRLELGNELWETAAAREELLHALLDELESVPSKYADLLKLIFIEGLNYEEAARQLSIPITTIRKQKERGLRTFREAVLKKHLLGLAMLFFVNFPN